MEMRDICTICITANPIPGHPKISFIEDVLNSLRFLKGMEDADIILSHDGNQGNVISDEEYEMYFSNLDKYTAHSSRRFKFVRLDRREYLVGNLRNAMRHISTPFTLNIQHDMPFVREIDIKSVVNDMQNHPEMLHVRFNRRQNVKVKFDTRGPNVIWEEFNTKDNVYVKTNGWSAMNHLTRVDYLVDILDRCDKPSPEKFIMQLKAKPPIWRAWAGTFIYDGIGSEPTTCHKNARKLVDHWSYR